MFFRRNQLARQNDKRRTRTLRIGRVEALEVRQVLSAVSEVLTQFDTSRVLVKFRDSSAIEPVKGTSLGEEVGLVPGLYKVNVLAGTDLDEVIAAYQSQANVEYAQHDFQIQVARTPNDTNFGSLYGMAKIGAPAAWDRTTGSSSIIVGVIDTGIDYNHPDLAANIWRNTREVAGNGVDDDGNGYRDDTQGWDFANNDNNPMDDNGHGTHVAGTIGAVGNNGVGVAGVAWNVKLMPLKFLAANGSGTVSAAISAINYAVRNGAKILNNSWGGGGYSSALDNAIAAARSAGVIFVAAAGNSATNNDTTPSYPANYNYDNVVSVAATDSGDRLASFSNFGASTVDIAAPGVGILSTTPNNTYSSFSGTSMATPHVAGAAALVWAVNPTWTYSQVIQRLYSTSDVISGLNGKVAGSRRLNVGNAVQPVTQTDSLAPTVTGAVWSGTAYATSSVAVTFSEAVQAGTVNTTNVKVTNPAGQAITVTSIVAGGDGKTFTINFANQTAVGAYKLTVLPGVKDLAGNALNQDGDTLFGEATQDQFTSTNNLIAAPVVTTFTNATAVALRDLATTTISLNVTDNLTIDDLNVRLNLTHTYVSDLVITLTAPSGQTVTLFNRRGGSGDNLTNTLFDDEGTSAIANGVAPFSGTFRPESALSALDGLSTKGTWRLSISDRAAADTGRFQSMSLVVTPRVTGAVRGRAVDMTEAPTSEAAVPVSGSTTTQPGTPTVGSTGQVASLVAAPGTTWRQVATMIANPEQAPVDTPRRAPLEVVSVDLDALFADLDSLLAE